MGFFTPAIRKYLSTVAHEATGKMLDVGCGDKPYRDLFDNVTEYIGIDRPSSVDQKRPESAGRISQFDVVGSAAQLPFQNEIFDTILCTQVIEHLPNPVEFFLESARITTRCAKLLLTAPLVNPVHEAPYDFFRYTNYGLTELCLRGGWRVKSITPLGGAWLASGYLLLQTIEQRALLTSSLTKKYTWRMIGAKLYTFMEFMDKRYPQKDTTVGFLLVASKKISNSRSNCIC